MPVWLATRSSTSATEARVATMSMRPSCSATLMSARAAAALSVKARRRPETRMNKYYAGAGIRSKAEPLSRQLLGVAEPLVEAALRQQGLVAALFDDAPVLEHDDAIGAAQGGQAVGDRQHGGARRFQPFLQPLLGFAVE